MPPVYQPTPDISSNLRRHRKKKSISGYHRQLNNVRSEEPLSGISRSPTCTKLSNFKVCSLRFLTYHLLGTLALLQKKKNLYKKNLYNPESIGTLKSPWKLVTSVIALSLPDLNTHIMIHVLQLNNNHVHSYFCLKEIFTRFF